MPDSPDTGPDTAPESKAELAAKNARLGTIVRELRSAAVALSGGVDSSLLAAVCHDELGARALAVIARTPSLPARELDIATDVADHIGIAWRIVDTSEVDDPRYAANRPDRCFVCKDELFGSVTRVADAEGLAHVVHGENLDDDGDHRPGRAAAERHGVRAPLHEAGLTKAEVRALARALELPVWDKPAFACLASRFPHGETITPDKLAQVERAEDALWRMGFRQFRVRHHGDVASIELDPDDLPTAVELADRIVAEVSEAGFAHVTLDLAGYRRGNLSPRTSRSPRGQLPMAAD